MFKLRSARPKAWAREPPNHDDMGALRDMVQNHMLQLLCLVAMEPPPSLDPDVVRDARIDAFVDRAPSRATMFGR